MYMLYTEEDKKTGGGTIYKTTEEMSNGTNKHKAGNGAIFTMMPSINTGLTMAEMMICVGNISHNFVMEKLTAVRYEQ